MGSQCEGRKYRKCGYRDKKNTVGRIFWDITLCSLLKGNQRFGGTSCLHLWGRRISQARNQREAVRKQSSV
jgi:hypothetical protein